MTASSQPGRQAHHHTFVIEREFTFAPGVVFDAYTDPEARKAWFVGPAGWEQGPQSYDFRVGGRATSSGGPKGGFVSTYDATFLEIVPGERLISAFMMSINDVAITASLATVEFRAGDYGTRLLYTEQIAFLDGHDHLPQRIEGSEAIFDNFEAFLVNTHPGA